MVVAIEFIDNIHQQSIILETDSITSCIISTTDLKLNISLSPSAQSTKNYQRVYIICLSRQIIEKKILKNNSAVKPLGCASRFHFSFENYRRHFYDQKG